MKGGFECFWLAKKILSRVKLYERFLGSL